MTADSRHLELVAHQQELDADGPRPQAVIYCDRADHPRMRDAIIYLMCGLCPDDEREHWLWLQAHDSSITAGERFAIGERGWEGFGLWRPRLQGEVQRRMTGEISEARRALTPCDEQPYAA